MTDAQRAVLRFPTERVARPARGGATWFDILAWRLRQTLGRVFNKVGAPGAIRKMKIDDKLAGQSIEVSVGELFVCLTVNDRDYYFDRLSGRFDGTGASPD